jgi:hypothetical protein
MATGIVKGVKARLDLEKIEQKDETQIIASITTKDGPLKEVRLIFLLNNRPVGDIQETNPVGRASVTLEKSEPGNYQVTVQALDGDLRETISFTTKGSQEKVPDNFDARVIGDKDEGKIKFAISVYSNHKGCKGTARILENETGKVFQFPTDENGVGVYPEAENDFLTFEQDRTYVIRVDHVEKEEKFSLEAPPHYEAISFVRIFLCWGIVILWLIGNLMMSGIGIPERKTSIDYQTYIALPEHERYALERMYRREGKELPKSPTMTQQMTENTVSGFRWASWRLFWTYIVFAIVYTITRLWRLISRAWTHVQRRINEDRAGTSEEFGRAGQARQPSHGASTTAASEPSQPGGWSWRRTMHEFINELFAEIVIHGFRR